MKGKAKPTLGSLVSFMHKAATISKIKQVKKAGKK